MGTNRLQDPFEAYRTRLAARIARQDQSDESLKRRADAAAEREKDRTTWLGTNLGDKGDSKAVREEKKRKAEEDEGVGKYLAGGKGKENGKGVAGAGTGEVEFGLEKKKKKGGGFGDFSGW
jgi:peptidyl-prolyl cis-trans isomerase-like protein 2